jgi:hypothetical protein
MWILLMIIFSQPFEVGQVDILGTYADQDRCMSEHSRAIELETPQPASFGCIQLGGVHEINAAFHQQGDDVPMLQHDGHGPGGP